MIPEMQAIINDINEHLKGPANDWMYGVRSAQLLMRVASELQSVQEGLREMEIHDRQFIWNAIHKIADAAKVTL